jgi:hypothetical protein
MDKIAIKLKRSSMTGLVGDTSATDLMSGLAATVMILGLGVCGLGRETESRV